MKIIISAILFLLSVTAHSQTQVGRAGGANTVLDSALFTGKAFRPPAFADTTTANTKRTLDSAGKLLYTFDVNGIWFRQNAPKKWVRLTDANSVPQSITNISIINQVDSSITIEICVGVDNCDTVTYTTSVTNATSIQLITDSSVSVCSVDTVSGGTVTICDTIIVGKKNTVYFFQNGIGVLAGSNGVIVEHGYPLLHNTTMDVGYYKYTIPGTTIYDYPFNVSQGQGFSDGTGVASFLHSSAGANKFGINYTGNNYPGIGTGYFGSTVQGYLLGTNATGNGSYGMGIGDQNAKVGGLIIHTKDTTVKDAVTIYGARPPLISQAWNMQPNTMDSTRIAVFKHDKQVQFKGYGAGTREAVPNTISGWDANGNFVEVDTANMGGSVTFIDSTKIIICSFGNYLCDTIYTTEGGLMSIYAANGLTKRNDSTLILGGTLDQNTTIATTANYGLTISGDVPEATSSGTLIVTNNHAQGRGVWVTANGGSGIGVNSAASDGYGVYSSTSIGTAVAAVATTSGVGLSAQSVSGLAAQLTVIPSSTNTTVEVLKIQRQSSGTAANSIGGSVGFYNQTTSGGNSLANQIISKWTDATSATRESQMVITGVNSGSTVDKLYIGGAATQVNATRFETYQGAAVVAANDLTLGTDGNLFSITGNTQINAITTANWQAGSEIGFIFTGTPTLKNNTAGGAGTATMLLAGRTDYTAAAGDYISFRYDGTNWYETQRKLAGTVSSGLVTADNGLTANTATNVRLGGTGIQNTNIDWSNFSWTNTWNTLSGSGLILSSTSTAAAGGAQRVLSVSLSGANATASQTTYGVYSHNEHTGTSATNIGVYGQVTNGQAGSAGVYGNAAAGQIGVWGNSVSGDGVRARSTSGYGLYSETTSGNASAFLTSNPSSANDYVGQLRLFRTTSGTAANGIGGGIDFYIEDDAGGANGQLSNQIKSIFTVAATATRTSQMVITGVNSGTTVDVLTLNANGAIQLRPITATAASAITAADGMILYVNSTDATFTSVGFWARENGAWVKM